MVAATAILNQPKLDPCLEFEHKLPNGLTCIEFFAGIGLTHLGLGKLGWTCVYSNDIEPKKRSMYESCFGPADYYHVEDVWQTKRILDRIPPERADLATASFPCVDLSLAGNLKGFSGSQSGAFHGFIKVLKKLREQGRAPKAVLVENVIGFLSAHDGKFFRVALRQLSDLGYFLDAFVVDAKHFTPQSRPRLFVVAFEEPLIPGKKPDPYILAQNTLWGSQEPIQDSLRPARLVDKLSTTKLTTAWIPLRLPALPPVNRNLHEYIDTDDSQDWWAEWRVKKHLSEMHPEHFKRVEALRKGAQVSIATIYRRVRYGRSRSEIRTDGLAGCLRTPRGGSSKQIVVAAGRSKIRMRWMTPREYARLQGCPEFPIEVDRNAAMWGFGDGVCVPVISWIAENVLTQLFTSAPSLGEAQQTACD